MDKSENVMFTTTSSSYDARVHSPDNEVINNYHDSDDVFGHEQHSTIKYKTLSWQIVSILMIAEIVSNGMLSLPSSLAVVGLAPGLILIIFLGAFAAYTSLLLVRFKLRHPSVHNMGDAGQILFGAFGREIFAFGTLFFAVLLAGGQMLSGQIALAKLSENGLCNISFTGLFAAATFLCALPRTYDYLGWISMASVGSIVVAGIVGMIGAGIHPVEKAEREVVAARSSDFQTAFFSITNPVFAYCGHFMFFALMSEMKTPQDAIKAAYTLQTFATTYYSLFAAITYAYLGSNVASPSFSSLETSWSKAAYGIALPNLLIAGALYVHTASKILVVRFFRGSRHLQHHTLVGWLVWIGLVAVLSGLAFLLAVGVPIFNYLLGITASAFAAWFTYGIAGMFWLHDSYHDGAGFQTWKQKMWTGTLSAILTILAGLFICIAGLYVTIQAIVDAYADGTITAPFSC